jgi:hypothetical protein
MPEIATMNIDPLALTALGFLVAVLAITFGLFGWIMVQSGKRSKPSASSAGTE